MSLFEVRGEGTIKGPGSCWSLLNFIMIWCEVRERKRMTGGDQEMNDQSSRFYTSYLALMDAASGP